MGEVEVSLDATLDDLKLQVMTLPAINDLGVPMTEFLRIRVIEDGELATVLKGGSQTLRYIQQCGTVDIACDPNGASQTVIDSCKILQKLLVVLGAILNITKYCKHTCIIFNVYVILAENDFATG